MVLDPVDGHPPGPSLHQLGDGIVSAELLRTPWTAALTWSGRCGSTAITLSSGFARSASAKAVGDLGGPQVLVLDVDQLLRLLDRLAVAAGDAALAAAGERVVATVAQVRIGTQQLDQVRTARHRRGRRRLCRQRVGPRGRRRPAGRAAGGAGSGSAAWDRSSVPGRRSPRRRRPVRRWPTGCRARPGARRMPSPSTGPADRRGGAHRRVGSGTGRCRRRRRRRAPAGPRSGSRRTSDDASRPCGRACRAVPRHLRSCSSSPVWRFSVPENESLSQCERQIRPRTSTPRRSAAPSSSDHRRSGIVGELARPGRRASR